MLTVAACLKGSSTKHRFQIDPNCPIVVGADSSNLPSKRAGTAMKFTFTIQTKCHKIRSLPFLVFSVFQRKREQESHDEHSFKEVVFEQTHPESYMILKNVLNEIQTAPGGQVDFFSGESYNFQDYRQLIDFMLNPRDNCYLDKNVVWPFKPAFLNGDMKFFNIVLGLKPASSNYPCPVCYTKREDFPNLPPTHSPEYRNYQSFIDGDVRQPYRPLVCPSTHKHIVPLPLHLCMGLCTGMIELLKDEKSDLVLDKSIIEPLFNYTEILHTGKGGVGGRLSTFSLLGDEIKRLLHLKSQDSEETISIFQLVAERNQKLVHPLTKEHHEAETRRIERLNKMHDWSMMIWNYLMVYKKSDFWAKERKSKFGNFVEEIHTEWTKITGLNYTPKLHMLVHHVWDVIAEHGCLSEVSESSLESTYASLNYIIRFEKKYLLNEIVKLFIATLDTFYCRLIANLDNYVKQNCRNP